MQPPKGNLSRHRTSTAPQLWSKPTETRPPCRWLNASTCDPMGAYFNGDLSNGSASNWLLSHECNVQKPLMSCGAHRCKTQCEGRMLDAIFYQRCDCRLVADDVLYHVRGKLSGNILIQLAISWPTRTPLLLSNGWLSLLKHKFLTKDSHSLITHTALAQVLCNAQTDMSRGRSVYIKEDAVSLVTSFSSGTVHGYIGLWDVLLQYEYNRSLTTPHRLLVYTRSQPGILEIVKHLATRGRLFNSRQLIYLKSDTTYRFRRMLLIPTRHIMPNKHTVDDIFAFIKRYFIDDPGSSQARWHSGRVAILKSKGSIALTTSGMLSDSHARAIASMHNATMIYPERVGEVSTMLTLYNVSTWITTWGTAFFKNLLYLGTSCTDVVVYVVGDLYCRQYAGVGSMGNLLGSHRNATIRYVSLCKEQSIPRYLKGHSHAIMPG